MKRLIAHFLAAGLILSTATAAQAVDFKVKGLSQHRLSWADRNFTKGNGDDNFKAASRLRTTIEAVVSESLKGVVFLEVGHQNWGVSRDGASLGTDGKQVKVSWSYVDWSVPKTETRVRMGLQPYTLPTFTGTGSPILDGDGAGISISNRFSENVEGTLFWIRPGNDNASEETGKRDPHDAMDFIGVTLPLSLEGLKVIPWGMYGIIGRDSLHGSAGDLEVAAAGLLPQLATPSIVSLSDDAHGDAWFGGVASELTVLDPFRFAFDAAYGSVDIGSAPVNGRKLDVKRSGWYAAFLAEYKMENVTPGLLFWYASGDDANPWNGSERMPSLDPDVYVTSYGFDGTYYGGAAQTMGYGLSGTWAVMAQLSDISFLEDLKHTVRVVYYQGTNNTQMVREKSVTNPQDTMYSMLYLTTEDKAFEVNVDSSYKIYENLSLYWELGYIRLDMDEALWKNSVGYEANKNNFKCTLSMIYTF